MLLMFIIVMIVVKPIKYLVGKIAVYFDDKQDILHHLE